MAEKIYIKPLDAALDYAKQGYRVFPLHSPRFNPDGTLAGCSCGKPDCKQVGKHPRTLHGLKDATTDPARIELWWTQWPGANVGIATGKESGIVVIDLDMHKADGFATWAQVEAKHGEFATREAKTGGGGRHLVASHPGADVKNTAGTIPGVDVRGDGGYIVAAPSIHASGEPYEWLNYDEPSPMPMWMVDWVLGEVSPLGTTKPGAVIEARERMNGTVEAAGRDALERLAKKLANTKEGRNNELNRCAFILGGYVREGALERDEVEAALIKAGHTNRMIEDDGQTAFDKTLNSGLGSGAKKATVRTASQPATGQGDEAGGAKKSKRPTDRALADRWISEHPDTAYGLGEFRRYTVGYWTTVERCEVEKEVLNVLEAAEPEGVQTSAGIMDSVRRIASVRIGQPSSKWDADEDIIVCANGTLHIPTMTLREWAPADYMTSGVGYNYDPAATCPNFLRVVRASVPDAHDLLQEFAGVCLTTMTEHELALWLVGEGGGGKSTLVGGFQAMLGKGKWTKLGLKDIENSRFALSRLPGKTLAISTEQPSGLIHATDVLNQIISGEPVTVEQKFKEQWDFVPKVKLLWAMNELPRVPDSNSGLFRRVKVIEVPSIPKDKRDPNVKLGVMQEGAGILNWALEGLHRFRRNGGYTIPASVEATTENFKLNNDVAALFVAECCEVREDMRAKASSLYSIYNQWVKDNGHGQRSSTRFSEDMKRLGFRKGKYNGNPHYYGVGVRSGIPYLP